MERCHDAQDRKDNDSDRLEPRDDVEPPAKRCAHEHRGHEFRRQPVRNVVASRRSLGTLFGRGFARGLYFPAKFVETFLVGIFTLICRVIRQGSGARGRYNPLRKSRGPYGAVFCQSRRLLHRTRHGNQRLFSASTAAWGRRSMTYGRTAARGRRKAGNRAWWGGLAMAQGGRPRELRGFLMRDTDPPETD